MKKLVINPKLIIALCIAITAIIVFLVFFIISYSKENYHFPQRGITLNNVLSADAEEMVSNFKVDTKCSDRQTAFWLDSAWVNHVYDIIMKEHGDGIRIYFGKGQGTGRNKNSAVIVSTYKASDNDPKAESNEDHADYYEHIDPFFSSPLDKLIPNSSSDPGALLFCKTSPCATNNHLYNSPNDITCENAYQAVNHLRGKEGINTRSEWFSLKVMTALKRALALQTQKFPGEPGDGIRIYFAKHTDGTGPTAIGSTNPKHHGRHAIIIIATKTEKVGGKVYHWDFFYPPDELDNLRGELLLAEGSDPGGSDNAEQCQPNCQGVTLP